MIIKEAEQLKKYILLELLWYLLKIFNNFYSYAFFVIKSPGNDLQ